jgi:hypothetical protein
MADRSEDGQADRHEGDPDGHLVDDQDAIPRARGATLRRARAIRAKVRGQDAPNAQLYARRSAIRRAGCRSRNPTSGIAAAHGFSVASRDTSAFRAAGLKVIDPWEP